MDYRIEEKGAFTVVGLQRTFWYEEAAQAVPQLWEEFQKMPQSKGICPMYGINADADMGGNQFEYIIADNYNPAAGIPEGFVTRQIPAFTWAVFACRGPMPHAIQDVNQKIYSQWLPNSREYEIAAGYCVELYDDGDKYLQGLQDANYYCELWIPVKKK